VAAHARSLRDLGFRNHAATNAGENGDSLLEPLTHPASGQLLANVEKELFCGTFSWNRSITFRKTKKASIAGRLCNFI
jgi:hypothetical protein